MADTEASSRRARTLAVIGHEDMGQGYRPPDCVVSNGCRGDFHRANTLWIARGELTPNTLMQWHGQQGDEAIFVLDGALELDGQLCVAGDALMVDAQVTCAVRAAQQTCILHFGSMLSGPIPDSPLGPVQQDNHSSRVMRAADAVQFRSTGEDGTTFLLKFFADGSCATNRAALFSVSVDGPSFAPPHSHSEDELIHILAGGVRSGTLGVPVGHTLAVPKDIRYSFRTDGPATFLNFRRDASYIEFKRERRLETIASRLGAA